MAMQKEELKERINKLPEFERRDVKVRDDTNEENENWTKQKDLAICKVGESISYAYVAKNYSLVQFKDVFGPILDSIQEDVKGYLADYGGYAMLKIFPELEQLKDGNSQFGLIAINSVDKSSSIVVKFCVRHNDHCFTIPSSVAGLKKQHTGKVEKVTKDYISMMGKVKVVWKNICENFPKYRVVEDEEEIKDEEQLYVRFKDVIENLSLGKGLAKQAKEHYLEKKKNGQSYSLWDVLLLVMNRISDKTYKSDIHREKKIDRVCDAIFQYSIALNI